MNGAIKLWAITLGAMGLGLWAAQHMGGGSKDAVDKVLARVDIVFATEEPQKTGGDVFMAIPVGDDVVSVSIPTIAGSYGSTARVEVRPGSVLIGQLTE